jgi:hypothetical protein
MLVAIAAAVSVVALAGPAGPVRYVDDDGAPGGDGLTWDTAYAFLQDALAEAGLPGSDILEIRVAQGTYAPDRNAAEPDGSGDRLATFQLLSGVSMLGGYAGLGAADPDRREVRLFESILSGDLLGDDQPDFINVGDNSYSVVTGSGTDATARLDGFVIAGGNADGTEDDALSLGRGGGLWSFMGSPTIANTTFRHNRARLNGGAMYNHTQSSPAVTGCTFHDNVTVQWSGGAVFNYLSGPAVTDCRFEANRAQNQGGAVFNHTSTGPTILHCALIGNTAVTQEGGAISSYLSTWTVSDCRFEGNIAMAGDGGAISGYRSNATIEGCWFEGNSASVGAAVNGSRPGESTVRDCVFENNHANFFGGAVRFGNDADVDLRNCIFRDNTADLAGGGLIVAGATRPAEVRDCVFLRNDGGLLGGGFIDDSGSMFVNCVVSRNVAIGFGEEVGGGGGLTGGNASLVNCSLSGNDGWALRVADAGTALFNCIIWGNTPGQIDVFETTCTLYFCDIEGGWSGPGSNIMDEDPLFLQAEADDLRLGVGSPCINAGDNAAVPKGLETDVVGKPRILDGIVDMGAYEGGYEPLPLAGGHDASLRAKARPRQETHQGFSGARRGACDVVAVLSSWGDEGGRGSCDLNLDGVVDELDLVAALGGARSMAAGDVLNLLRTWP